MNKPRLSTLCGLGLLAVLALAPLVGHAIAAPYIETVFCRVAIFAIAVTSLNLIIGYAGLISFGHVLFFGIGIYSVGIASHYGIAGAGVHFAAAIAAAAIVAAVTGALCRRVSGVYFIMITLAFSQMFYFLAVSLQQFGGDEGMTIHNPTAFAGHTLAEPNVLYATAFVILTAAIAFSHRLVESRFGKLVRGSRDNDRRMRALGFETFRYRLAMYVIAGVLCAIAGVLYANLNAYASPDFFTFSLSGELLIMLVAGGTGTLFGPLAGTMAFIVLQTVLSGYTEHWMIVFGPVVVVMALVFRQGIFGWIARLERAAI